MPQVFQVLKCYKCFVFQIHQTKKTNKFDCKMCGEKQSVKRHYGIGTGKDCRMHVQKLNILRGNIETKSTVESNSDEENEESKTNEDISEDIMNSEVQSVKRSKWSAFLDKKYETEHTQEPMFLGDRKVFLDIPQKRKICKSKVTKANQSESLSVCNKNYSDFLELERKQLSAHGSDTVKSNNTTSICINQLKDKNFNNAIAEETLFKTVSLQTINENSRWAQFVDIEEDIHDKVEDCVLKSDHLFSLCDDNDLDKVLDI